MKLGRMVVRIAKYYFTIYLISYILSLVNRDVSQIFYIVGLVLMPIYIIRSFRMSSVLAIQVLVAILTLSIIYLPISILLLIILLILFRDELLLLIRRSG